MHNDQTPVFAISVFLHKSIQFFLQFHMKYRSSGKTIYIAQKTALKNGYAAIGVARIFDWGGPKPQITRNDVIRNFRKSTFLWGKDIVEWKI